MLFSISYRTVKPDVLPKFNELDGRIDRRSHEGMYEIVNGLPRYASAIADNAMHLLQSNIAMY